MITQVDRHNGDVAALDILDLADQVARADGVEALSEQTVLELRTPVRPVRHFLAHDDGGGLVGYAQLDPGEGDEASAELAVVPLARRRGVGRALLDAVRAAAPGVSVWAHGNLTGAQALAASAGMSVARELLQMSAPLGPVDATVPRHPGVVVQTFEPDRDEDDWVTLNARAFATHPEQGRMTVADLRAREAEAWFDPTLLWLVRPVTAPDGAPLASMWVKVVPGERSGEIYALGVDPAAQGQGLGGMLTRRALAELHRRGLSRATLYVEGDNAAALRTYQREGFHCVAIDVQYR
ncbi:mycothiol synthase [Georgenia yuyongxinii]|uniref:Mycothiol acetyltransferase n=1 Tax=Georgenia yuyongxinii TaxID=2589797 RepID=A0A552WMH9_9MICO|nr:mycothiol synthase [Georgenia yuyongxinii]TRW43988.1 mycothiol synthase [Georgenia yuyongxinii]